MKFKIVADSCCELEDKFKSLENIELIPLTLTVSGEDIVDDETFDQNAFIQKVKIAWVVFLRGIRGRKTPMEKLFHRYNQNHPAHPRPSTWKHMKVIMTAYL